MTDTMVHTEGGPKSGLETWLVRGLQNGRFEGLPPYRPLRGGGRRAEQYARELLTGLKDDGLSGWDRERLRDDGRAFRSWAETYPAAWPAS
jgi:hypothetical protein